MTKDNFTLMYNLTYNALVKSRIVIELEDGSFLDKEGRTVLEHDVDRCGNATKYKMILTK